MIYATFVLFLVASIPEEVRSTIKPHSTNFSCQRGHQLEKLELSNLPTNTQIILIIIAKTQ